MRKTFALIVLLAFLQAYSYGQANSYKSLWGTLEVGYGWSASKDGQSYNATSSNTEGRMHVMGVRAIVGYYLTPQISLGGGVGFNGYRNSKINTLPVFVDVRYLFTNQLFAYADIGGSVASGGDFMSGFMMDAGLGYRIALGERSSLNPSIGYNLFSYSQVLSGNDSENRSRHTLFLRLGFEF